MQALEGADTVSAKTQSDHLDALLWRTSQKNAEDKQKGMQAKVQAVLAVASLDLRGNVASSNDEFEQAKALLEEAVKKEREIGYTEPPFYSRPALESLGYACIRAGHWDEARDAFKKVLSERPKSGFGLYGIAVSYSEQGDAEHAGAAYSEFLDRLEQCRSRFAAGESPPSTSSIERRSLRAPFCMFLRAGRCPRD